MSDTPPGANDDIIYQYLNTNMQYHESLYQILCKMDFSACVVSVIDKWYKDSIVDWFDCGNHELAVRIHHYFLFPYRHTMRIHNFYFVISLNTNVLIQ